MRTTDLDRRGVLAERRRPRGHAWHVVQVGVAVLLGSVALLTGAAWTFLETPWGGEALRKVVVTRANRALAGRLAIGRLAFGGHRLVLERVALRDPDGAPVARVARIEVSFSPLALLHRHLDVYALVIERPELLLASDEGGLSLARAVAAREPACASRQEKSRDMESEGGGFAVDLRQVALSDGRVDYRVDGAERVHLRDVSVHGSFRQRRDVLALDAAIDANGGRVDVRAELDPARHRTRGEGVTVRAQGLDAAAWLEGAPRSDLGFALRAQGGGTELAALEGALEFHLAPGKLDGGALGPIGFTIRGRRGRYELADLLAVLPGLRVIGNGQLDSEGPRGKQDLDAHVRIEASDLAALVRALTGPGRKPPASLAGNGRLDVAVGGTLTAPSLKVAAAFPFLALGKNRVQALTASVDVPDVRAPEAADVDLRTPIATVGGQSVRALVLSLRGSGTHISGSARMTAPYPLALSLRAERPHPHSRLITLRALSIRYAEASWSLASAATVELGAPRLAVRNLALRAGQELIRLDAEKTERAVDVSAHIAGLDLARLPRALVPPGLGVGGRVDAELRVAGRTAAPHIDLSASLAGGRVHGYRNLALQLDARMAGSRVRGTLDARGLGTAASARFDLPMEWPPEGRARRSPLRFDLLLADTDLASLDQALRDATGGAILGKGGRAIRGMARLHVHLDGTAEAPRLALDAGVRALAAGNQKIGDVELAVKADDDRPIEAHLRAPPVVRFDATTPLTLRSIARHPPGAAALARTVFDARGEIQRLPFADLAPLLGGRLPPPLGGTISAEVELSGTAHDPRGKLALDVAGLSSGRFPATDGRLELALDRRAIDARARVVRHGHPLLAATAWLSAGLETLRTSPGSLADAQVRVRAVVGPLSLHRLGLPPDNDRDPPRALQGLVHADLTVDGTVGAPRVLAHFQAGDIRLDQAAMGAAQLTAHYENRRATADVLLTSKNGGQLHATVATTADLGYPAVTRGLAVRDLPVEARLDARGFDLVGFSGLTQDLRTVAGNLDGSLAAGGTMGNPTVSGRLEWKDGALALYGLGDYRAIHLALHGDRESLTLDELAGQSGGGKARLTGNALQEGARGYQIDARASLAKFPLYKDGQPLATVSLQAGVKGTVSPLKTRLEIGIEETRIALSDAKRRDLQPLAAPNDVVLVEDGKPLNRAQAKRLHALEASRTAKDIRAPAASAGVTDGATPDAESERASDSAARVRVAMRAERRLWVSGKDAYIELGLAPGFRVSVDGETRVFGEVSVYRGRLNVLGRRFDLLADSTLQFGGPPERPEVDVRAQYRSYEENVTVLLTVKGTLDHLQTSVSAPERPELTQSQLYTLIITGHLQFGEGGAPITPANEAASLLGGVIASQLQKTLASKLPLDILTIDPGSGTSMTGAQLEAGRYMTQKLYVGYVGRVGADPSRYENRNAVHVEYQLTSRWQIAGEYGDLGTGTADLMWKKSY